VTNDWQIAGIGDFYLTGHRNSIVWRNLGTSAVEIWEVNASGQVVASGGGQAPGNSWIIQGVGDFTGGGASDILWRNNNGQLVIWVMNGGVITASGGGQVIP